MGITRNLDYSPFAQPAATACIVGDAGHDQENDHVDNMLVHDLSFGDRAYLIFNLPIHDVPFGKIAFCSSGILGPRQG